MLFTPQVTHISHTLDVVLQKKVYKTSTNIPDVGVCRNHTGLYRGGHTTPQHLKDYIIIVPFVKVNLKSMCTFLVYFPDLIANNSLMHIIPKKKKTLSS